METKTFRFTFKRGLLKLWGWLPLPRWGRWLILWMGLPKFLVGATAVIFDEEGRVLLFHHTYKRETPWDMPGGWIKIGEDATTAIVREVYEEGGLHVQVIRPVRISGCRRERRFDLLFLCELQGGQFRPSEEVFEMRFFAMDELRDVVEPHRYEVLQEIASSLGLNQRETNNLPTSSTAV